MKRRHLLNETAIKRIFQAHAAFVLILTVGAYFRIAFEDGDRNTDMFALIVAIGVIIALSLFNKIIIDIGNSINTRWTVVNYCIPAILLGLLSIAARIPAELLDILLLAVLVLIADMVMYSWIEKTNETIRS